LHVIENGGQIMNILYIGAVR